MSQKYSSETEEQSLWLVLSGLWAGLAFVAWLSSALGRWETIDGGTLTALALLVACIGVALRLPILTGACERTTRASDELADHMVLLLGYIATVNWLGHFVLRSASLFELLPALAILMLAEVWVHRRFFSMRCLKWLKFFWMASKYKLRDVAQTIRTTPASARQAPESLVANNNPEPPLPQPEAASDSLVQPDVGLVEAAESSDLDCVQRECTDSVDEHGRRQLAGRVRLQFAASQSKLEFPVGFCPPFVGEPDIDFEAEDAEVELRLVACTPQGMRLAARRSNVENPLESAVEWFAIQVEKDSESQNRPGILP